MDISVVIPLFNEVESIRELHGWIKEVMQKNSFEYEIVFIDDGSTDGSWKIIEELANSSSEVKGIRFKRNYGKSAALFSGFQKVAGEVVITMDGDLQDSPEEIPELYKMIHEEDYDMVSGWKKKRYDPISKTLPSKLFNYTARKVTKIHLHDFNCGLKAYKNELVKDIDVYGEMHRYIPVLAKHLGFKKIGEKVVTHQSRKYGKTKFGLERFINGFLDLLTISFVYRFSKKPMHLFGTLGSLMFIFGGIIAVWIPGEKIYNIYNHLPVRDAVDQPLFFIALVMVIIGVQLFLAGFVAELIIRNSNDRDYYKVDKTIN
mgnify:CR=1 FL=1